jgi:chromosome partitioning protein
VARIIAITIPKGGTGKTTTTMNLGAALHERGHKVLLVDFDPQGNLTSGLGIQLRQGEPSIYHALKQVMAYERPTVPIRASVPGLEIIPASPVLNNANEELVMAEERERVLQRVLAPISANYDFVLIDTLPYLGLLVTNALTAATEVIIPLEAESFALESTAVMLNRIASMQRGLNRDLRITGILLTQVATRSVLHREVAEYVQQHFSAQAPIFRTVIPELAAFPQSQAMHQTILQFDSKGKGAQAYRALADEVLHA